MTGKVDAWKCEHCGELFETVQALAAHNGMNEFGRTAAASLSEDYAESMAVAVFAIRFRVLLGEALVRFPSAVEAACTTYFDTLAKVQPVSLNTPMTDGNEQESPNG